MPFTVAKQEYVGTKLDGPAMPAGDDISATITSVKDLGMVKVSPQYPREDGKTEVHQAEFIFTGANGTQAKKDATVSLHEKSFIYRLIKVTTGKPPADNFDLDTLVGKNVTLEIEARVSKKGKPYAKVIGVTRAPADQPTFRAPAPLPKGAAIPQARPQLVDVGF